MTARSYKIEPSPWPSKHGNWILIEGVEGTIIGVFHDAEAAGRHIDKRENVLAVQSSMTPLEDLS